MAQHSHFKSLKCCIVQKHFVMIHHDAVKQISESQSRLSLVPAKPLLDFFLFPLQVLSLDPFQVLSLDPWQMPPNSESQRMQEESETYELRGHPSATLVGRCHFVQCQVFCVKKSKVIKLNLINSILKFSAGPKVVLFEQICYKTKKASAATSPQSFQATTFVSASASHGNKSFCV